MKVILCISGHKVWGGEGCGTGAVRWVLLIISYHVELYILIINILNVISISRVCGVVVLC